MKPLPLLLATLVVLTGSPIAKAQDSDMPQRVLSHWSDAQQALALADSQVCDDRRRAKRIKRLRQRHDAVMARFRERYPTADGVGEWVHIEYDSCDQPHVGTSRDFFDENATSAGRAIAQAERLLGISRDR
ncbi:MAG TPA: hypothetical protein VEA44_06835 [Caulobacter sp.]|nr:hypothetical protein [Caulobacter sp.]